MKENIYFPHETYVLVKFITIFCKSFKNWTKHELVEILFCMAQKTMLNI